MLVRIEAQVKRESQPRVEETELSPEKSIVINQKILADITSLKISVVEADDGEQNGVV